MRSTQCAVVLHRCFQSHSWVCFTWVCMETKTPLADRFGNSFSLYKTHGVHGDTQKAVLNSDCGLRRLMSTYILPKHRLWRTVSKTFLYTRARDTFTLVRVINGVQNLYYDLRRRLIYAAIIDYVGFAGRGNKTSSILYLPCLYLTISSIKHVANVRTNKPYLN